MPDDTLDITRFAALAPGPKLLVLGAVHGNETCGPVGIGRVVAAIRDGRLPIRRGLVTFVPVANPQARRQNTREGDRNLNRDLAERAAPRDNEDRIGNRLCPLLREHDVLLDIHSFMVEAEPFVFAGPEDNRGTVEPFAQGEAEWRFASCLGPGLLIHGWLDGYGRYLAERQAHGFPVPSLAEGIGTTEYMRFAGGIAVTIECGQHDDLQAGDVAEAAIGRALAHLGLTDAPPPAATATRAIRMVEAYLCREPGDRLEPGFRTGGAVAAGQLLARRADGGALTAPRDGYLVFPNAKAEPGQLLCYFGVASDRPTASG